MKPDALQALEIRDAACIVLVDRADALPRMLLGRRHRDQVFLPGKWVFPGGRVDPPDHDAPDANGHAGLPTWLAPFARAAVRELLEETGIALSGPSPLAALSPLARAITPPDNVRRYDTWFFISDLNAPAPSALAGDGELNDLAWFTLEEAKKLDLPHITRLVLEDAAVRLEPDATRHAYAPFYRHGDAGFERTLVDCSPASAPP